MAIDTISPLQSSVIDPGDAISFIVDDTWTSMVVQAVTADSTELVYSSASGGGQAGYTVSVINSGGRDTFVVSRNAGWDKSPQQVIVTEDESGSSTQTTLSWFLSTTSVYSQGYQPFNAVSTGSLIVSEDDIVKRSDVGQIDFDDATFDVTDLGNGKVGVAGLGAGGSGLVTLLTSANHNIASSANWYTWAQAQGPNSASWVTAAGASGGNPTIFQFSNGFLVPNAGTLSKVQIAMTVSSATNFDLTYELWKQAMVDGATAVGATTKVASINFTTGTTPNQVHLKTFTIDSSALSAGDMLHFFGKSDNAANTRLALTIQWSET